MAKAPKTSRRKPAKKLQTPVGAEAKPEVAAATAGAAEAKVADGQIAAATADPAGAGAASAAAPEQSRDAAGAAATDRKAASDEGKEPGATHQPPVAEQVPDGELTRVLVASVSPKGRRRIGQAFGPEPTELFVSDATLERLRADPQLIVKVG